MFRCPQKIANKLRHATSTPKALAHTFACLSITSVLMWAAAFSRRISHTHTHPDANLPTQASAEPVPPDRMFHLSSPTIAIIAVAANSATQNKRKRTIPTTNRLRTQVIHGVYVITTRATSISIQWVVLLARQKNVLLWSESHVGSWSCPVIVSEIKYITTSKQAARLNTAQYYWPFSIEF